MTARLDNGFAAYEPDRSRTAAPDVRIVVREAQADDLAACARLIVTRTGDAVEEREARLRADLADPDRYIAVACIESAMDPDTGPGAGTRTGSGVGIGVGAGGGGGGGEGGGGRVIGYAGVIHHQVSPDHPPGTAPSGYYLIGLIIEPHWRRHGIGERLTEARMQWVAQRADSVWYFANHANQSILDLHRRFCFAEVTRDFTFPGAPLVPGTCILLRASLPGALGAAGTPKEREESV